MTSVEDPTRQIKERESLCFNDFPEDIQLCILSFLSPTEISSFACTSKRFASLCRDDRKLWCALCERRWGTKTQIGKWGNGRITYRQLYRTLEEWKNLIGFWRRCGQTNTAVSSPPLIFFEWGPFFLCASRVYPSKNGTYQVKTAPFLWMGISPDGQILNFLDLDGQNNWSGDVEACFKFGILDGSFVPVNVNFMGNGHVLVEEDHSLSSTSREEKRIGFRRSSSFGNLRGEESEDVVGGIPGSLPECSVSEMYTQFANRTSPGSDRRRQRRKEKGRQGRRKWEPEHFVKVSDCSPTPSRPLQGLWKVLLIEILAVFLLYLLYFFLLRSKVSNSLSPLTCSCMVILSPLMCSCMVINCLSWVMNVVLYFGINFLGCCLSCGVTGCPMESPLLLFLASDVMSMKSGSRNYFLLSI